MCRGYLKTWVSYLANERRFKRIKPDSNLECLLNPVSEPPFLGLKGITVYKIGILSFRERKLNLWVRTELRRIERNTKCGILMDFSY